VCVCVCVCVCVLKRKKERSANSHFKNSCMYVNDQLVLNQSLSLLISVSYEDLQGHARKTRGALLEQEYTASQILSI
jgi:hypothetical protein